MKLLGLVFVILFFVSCENRPNTVSSKNEIKKIYGYGGELGNVSKICIEGAVYYLYKGMSIAPKLCYSGNPCPCN